MPIQYGLRSVSLVAPLVGAWIEIAPLSPPFRWTVSLPLWERGLKFLFFLCYLIDSLSLPLWERGLKCISKMLGVGYKRRSPCGSVD